MKIFKSVLFLGIMSLFFSCNNKIEQFQIDDSVHSPKPFSRYFDKQAILPLKKEWKELYSYLKKGHVQRSEINKEFSYIYSYEFYQFLNNNLSKVYKTPFLQEYNQFISAFGEPEYNESNDDRILIAYSITVIDDPCSTCNHNAFSYEFDKKNKKLIKE